MSALFSVARAGGGLVARASSEISSLVDLGAPRIASAQAPAGTHLPPTTYNSDVTWTTANSPYILDGNVNVASGATLTIEPGVVVKLNGTDRMLVVDGTLKAIGTTSNRITFTSIQDDSIAGDSGGDGPTTGAPGQWWSVWIRSHNALSAFEHVDVRYGGIGSANHAYGAIQISGSATVTVDDANISHNQRSGILIGPGCNGCAPGAKVTNSLIEANGNGISVSMGWVELKESSTITGNSNVGLHINLISSYAGPASFVFRSDIAANGGNGVHLVFDQDLPTALWPHGNRNNIYANGGLELFTLFANRDVDWTGNFWGTDVVFDGNDSKCLIESPYSSGRLRHLSGDDGPFPSSVYLVGEYPDQRICDYDYIRIEPWEFSPTYIPNAGDVPPGQLFGSGSDLHAVNPSGFQSDPINSLTGSFFHSWTDLALPGIGIPFLFTRSYNSMDTTAGSLGPGWLHGYAASLITKANGNVIFRAEDGQRIEYDKQPDGSFSPPPGGRSELSSTQGGYELRRHDQVIYRFNDSGKLLSIRDRNDQGLTLAYNAGNLATITDSVGRVISLTHNPSGLLTDVTLPDGRKVSYGYTDGYLTSVTDARGKVTSYTYNPFGLLETRVDPNGNVVFRNTYSSAGRVTEQVDARGKKSTFSWNSDTQTSTMTDARGKVWKDVYSGDVLAETIDPLTNKTTFDYDIDLNVKSITDPRGNKTTMTYEDGNLITRTAPAPLSYVEEFTYNPENSLTSYTDPRGKETTFEYDAAGNLETITAPDNAVTELTRDPAGTGLITAATDPRNKTTSYSYDNKGNLTSVITPLGFKTTMGYDPGGRMTSVVEARGNESGKNPADYTWTFAYNNANQLTDRTDPLGNTTSWDYDPAGNLANAVDANGNTTTYEYNPTNHLASVTAGGAETSYGYDATGNLTTRTDPKVHQTIFGYDDAGRLSSVTSPLGKEWLYTYNGGGSVSQVTKPGGGTITFAYDEVNRLKAIDYSGTTPDVNYEYDASGNRTKMIDGAGTETYTYDDLNRLLTVTRDANAFSYVYDPASNVSRRTFPNGAIVDYVYDDDSRLDTVTHAGSTVDYNYNAAGAQTDVTLPTVNGYVETRTYDRALRLLTIKNAKGSSVLSKFTYAYDDVGNPISVTDQAGAVTTYEHNTRNFLKEVCYKASCPNASDPYIRYSYDSVGNRTKKTEPSGATTYVYNEDDKLTSSTKPNGSTTNYTWSANGNMSAEGTRTYSYDLADRLTSTTQGDTTIDYTYDGDGKRLRAASGPKFQITTQYLWDVNWPLPQLATETVPVLGPNRSYIHGNDLISMTVSGPSGDRYYYHNDGLGSVVNLTSSSGTPQWTYSYEPFGANRTTTQHSSSAPSNSMRFAGELLDNATGLYHLRARQYDPGQSRFLQLDPWPASLSDPYVASYGYVNNTPTTLTDPSGLCPWCIAGAIIGGALNGAAYALSSDDFTWRGFGASVASGAVAGGVTAAAGPLAGQYIASRSLAFAATMAMNAGGGALAVTAGSAVCGNGLPSAEEALTGAAGNALAGGVAEKIFPTRGIFASGVSNTYFQPKSLRAAFSSSIAGRMFVRQAGASSGFSALYTAGTSGYGGCK